MSDIIEFYKGVLVNRDNIDDARKNPAKNGGRPMIVIGFKNSIGKTYAFDSQEEMNMAYNKLLKKK